MIRHYEAIGLLPKARRTGAGYRLYDANDIHVLRFVRRARDLGFALPQVAALLALWRNPRRSSADVRRLAQEHIDELARRIDALRGMQAALAHLVAHCRGDARPQCPVLDDLATVARPPAGEGRSARSARAARVS
jgi:Cu(I)-responsive transcriptional regulator